MNESDYTSIADIAIWSWYGRLAMSDVYDAEEFLDTASYKHVLRWAKAIEQRDAVRQGLAAAR
jgi:GST-like protein